MKIFLSHSSKDKAIVREIKRKLPKKIKSWIDEEELLIGNNLELSLEKAITNDSDFLILFVSKNMLRSDWINKELNWALMKEKEIGRTFVLPIVLEEEAWKEIKPEEFKKRFYLSLYDQREDSVELLVKKLYDQLFDHLCHFLENEKKGLEKERDSWFGPIMNFSDTMKKNPTNWLGNLKEFVDFMDKIGFNNEKLKEKITNERDKYHSNFVEMKQKLDESKKEENPNIALLMYNVTLLTTYETIVNRLDKCLLVLEANKSGQMSDKKALDEIKEQLQMK